MVLGAIAGMIATAVIITGAVFVLRRTPRISQRVTGAPLAGDELTEHERELAISNLTIMNQQDILRRNGQLP